MTMQVMLCAFCASPVPETAAFCGSCGARREAAAYAAQPVPAVAPAPIPAPFPSAPAPAPAPFPSAPRYDVIPVAPASSGFRMHRTALIVGAGVAVVALIGGGLFASGIGRGPSPAQKRAAALSKEQAALRPALASLMSSRATFFASERNYLSSMRSTKSSLASYHAQYASVVAQNKQIDAAFAPQLAACQTYAYYTCPSPDYVSYPSAPDVSNQTTQLTGVSAAMTALHAQLVGVVATPKLSTEYAELLSAVDALGSDAKQNAGLLTEGVTAPVDGDIGEVDDTKLKGLDGNDALPSVRQMNRELVVLLNSVKIPLTSYDIPGGTDIDPSDHSTTI